MTNPPLTGLRVLDLTSGVAGPWCTKLLADYGADVIKIERPGVGDESRGHGRFPDGVPHRERSALFLWLNTSKRSVTLDVATRTGRELVLALAAQCDAVVGDRRPSELTGLRLTPDDLRRTNPSLVVTSVTAFGQSGPYAEYIATNLTSYAAGGQHYLTGDADREPLQNGGYQAEYQAGTWAFGATLAALRNVPATGAGQAAATGEGQVTATGAGQAAATSAGQVAEIAGVEVMASILEIYLPDYAYRKSEALTTRRGNISSATVGLYPAADGYIGIHAMPKNWPQLVEAMERPDLAADERFADNRARLRNDDALSAEFFLWTTSTTKAEAALRARKHRAPIAPVNGMRDLLASEQLVAREFFREIAHPEAGTYAYPGPPSRMPASPPLAGRAPLLGEHTAEVLVAVLGLTARDVALLCAAGVV